MRLIQFNKNQFLFEACACWASWIYFLFCFFSHFYSVQTLFISLWKSEVAILKLSGRKPILKLFHRPNALFLFIRKIERKWVWLDCGSVESTFIANGNLFETTSFAPFTTFYLQLGVTPETSSQWKVLILFWLGKQGTESGEIAGS